MPEWIEQLESRSIASSGGRGSGTRTFIASGYTGVAAVYAALGKKIGSVTVPEKGDGHPEFRGLIARDFTVRKVAGHSDLWEVEWAYEMVSSSWTTPPQNPVETLPNEVGYVELSSEIRAEFVLGYRQGANLPTDGDPNQGSDPEVDIGGTPIDAGGNPTSLIRRIQQLTLTETVNVPNFSVYGNLRFKRNSSVFEGGGVGKVMYRGASVRRTGVDVYQVAHSFVLDEEYHLVQQPIVDQEGRPVPDAAGHAKHAYVIQPFPDTGDFGDLSENF